MTFRITIVAFTPAPQLDQRDGLLGWSDITIDNAMLIAGVAVRRSLTHRLCLSFPEFTDGRGRKRHPVRPLNDDARIEIERQVIAELRRTGRLAA